MRAEAHNERCKDCKESIKRLLSVIFDDVEENYNINLPSRLEDYSGTNIYKYIAPIYHSLTKYRGYEGFVKAKKLPRVDFFIPTKNIIVEFDESQHFTKPREIVLSHYSDYQEGCGFPVDKWRALCQMLNKKDNDPPYRDEQRAWYDTLRDFAPLLWQTGKTIRLYSRDFVWCSLNINEQSDLKIFSEFIIYHNEGIKP